MKVLVVIDNVFQYDRLVSLVGRRHLPGVEFDFRHSAVVSAIWKHPDFQGKNKMIDVARDADMIIEKYKLVISVHCFQFFPAKLVSQIRCINVHPGYNPINRGWYPQVFAIVYGLPIGATIHEMDEQLDHGPIIARKFVEKHTWDTSYSIYNRVLEAEIELFESNIDAIIHGTYTRIAPEQEGTVYRKKDFNALCQLDMNEQGSFRQFYDRLRALSHGEYRNAWFIDPETGKKIFVKIDISEG